MTPTIRRYPRTLQEAFPQDHACAITHYPASPLERFAGLVLAFVLALFGALALVHWWAA